MNLPLLFVGEPPCGPHIINHGQLQPRLVLQLLGGLETTALGFVAFSFSLSPCGLVTASAVGRGGSGDCLLLVSPRLG